MEIKITEQAGLPARGARISKKTYNAIKMAKGNSAFFPETNAIWAGLNPFDPDYIIFIGDAPDNVLIVSSDVKKKHFANKTAISI